MNALAEMPVGAMVHGAAGSPVAAWPEPIATAAEVDLARQARLYGRAARACTPRRILHAVRWLYHRLGRTDRPNLAQPASAVGLLALHQLLTLADARLWPFSARTVAWLRRRPARRRHRRLDRLIEDLVAIAAEQPAVWATIVKQVGV